MVEPYLELPSLHFPNPEIQFFLCIRKMKQVGEGISNIPVSKPNTISAAVFSTLKLKAASQNVILKGNQKVLFALKKIQNT